jgi:hypothetical protein
MRGLLALTALLALGGCGLQRTDDVPTHPYSYHVVPAVGELRRVAVLPFSRGPRIGRAADVITASMASSLRELGIHQVVEVDPARTDLLPASDPVLTEDISSADLLRLRDRLNVDGVLVGRVEQFTSFDPIAIGVSVHLISCLDGQAAWSATGHFDGRRDDVQRDIQSWWRSHQAPSRNSVQGWQNTLQSPSLFTRYVCDRLVASMTQRVAPTKP